MEEYLAVREEESLSILGILLLLLGIALKLEVQPADLHTVSTGGKQLLRSPCRQRKQPFAVTEVLPGPRRVERPVQFGELLGSEQVIRAGLARSVRRHDSTVAPSPQVADVLLRPGFHRPHLTLNEPTFPSRVDRPDQLAASAVPLALLSRYRFRVLGALGDPPNASVASP